MERESFTPTTIEGVSSSTTTTEATWSITLPGLVNRIRASSSNNKYYFAEQLIQEKLISSTNHYHHNNNLTNSDITTWLSSNSVLILFILYAIVIFGGIFGNASLVISICVQKSGRLRKPLLFALCVADLLVVGVSAPLSIVLLSLAYDPWPIQSIGCKAIHYLRVSLCGM